MQHLIQHSVVGKFTQSMNCPDLKTTKQFLNFKCYNKEASLSISWLRRLHPEGDCMRGCAIELVIFNGINNYVPASAFEMTPSLVLRLSKYECRDPLEWSADQNPPFSAQLDWLAKWHPGQAGQEDGVAQWPVGNVKYREK